MASDDTAHRAEPARPARTPESVHRSAGGGARAPRRPAGDEQVALSHIGFSYGPDEAAAPALRDVSLTIRAGEHVCILGGNGSGKSTLLQLMNALLLPGSGAARIFGIDACDPANAAAIRRQAAMVFQHPEDQMTTSIVADDIAFGPENLGVPSEQIARRVTEALAAVGMDDYADADPADLSGGQQQRIAIAGALAMEPKMLLLDEPSAMLDTAGRQMIQRTLSQLNARGMTIVHVTHFMDDALRAQRVVIMDRGRVAFDGTPRDAFADASLVRRLGLELPVYLEISQQLRDAGVDVAPTTDPRELARSLAAAMRPRSPRQPKPARMPKGAVGGSGRPDAVATPATCTDIREEAGNARPDPVAAAHGAIEFEDVSFSYASARSPRKRARSRLPLFHPLRDRATDRGPLALAQANFRIEPGCAVALIGHTGSGKSTTMELACALKVPAAGTVSVDGIDTARLDERRALRRRIGYVSQLPERQLFAETVFDDIAFGPRNLGCDEREVGRRVRSALAACGIQPDQALLERSPFALSGGQQRCVALAGVLAMEPSTIVLDEPMAGLDPAGRAHLAALLQQLKQAGKTLLMVTHSMDDVAALADRAIVLDHGTVVADGSPRDVFAPTAGPRAAAIDVLGLPSALEVAVLAREHGAELGRPLTTHELIEEVLAHGAAR